MRGETNTVTVFNATALSGSANTTSTPAIRFNDYKPEAREFAAQVITVGTDSVLKLEILLSNDGTNFDAPLFGSEIITDHAEGNGFYYFSVDPALQMKIKATETAGHDITSMTVKISMV